MRIIERIKSISLRFKVRHNFDYRPPVSIKYFEMMCRQEIYSLAGKKLNEHLDYSANIYIHTPMFKNNWIIIVDNKVS